MIVLVAPPLFSGDLRQPICCSITNNLSTYTTVTQGLPQPVEQTSASGSHFTHTRGRSLLARTVHSPTSIPARFMHSSKRHLLPLLWPNKNPALNNPRTYSLSSAQVTPLVIIYIISEAQEFQRWAWSPASHQKPSRSSNTVKSTATEIQ